MSRIELDRQLEELRTAVLQMGEGVVASIDQAIEALTHQDHRALDSVITGDDTIDRACAAIEDLSARVITLQQPAVRDLRAVLAALIIAEELERIGDHAEGIAQLAARLPQPPDDEEVCTLTKLAALARVQLQGALDAYRAGDGVVFCAPGGRPTGPLAKDSFWQVVMRCPRPRFFWERTPACGRWSWP